MKKSKRLIETPVITQDQNQLIQDVTNLVNTVFKNYSTYLTVYGLINHITMIKYHPKDKDTAIMLSGVVERQLDQQYICSPEAENIHLDDFRLKCCILELVQLHQNKQVDIFKYQFI